MLMYRPGQQVVIRSDLRIGAIYEDRTSRCMYDNKKDAFVRSIDYVATIKRLWHGGYMMEGPLNEDTGSWAFNDAMLVGLASEVIGAEISESALNGVLEV